MNIQHIRSFVTFVESTTMEKAAKRLSLTQPALTQQLKNLEQELDLELFTFSGKKKILTLKGKEVYQHLKFELKSLEAAWNDVKKSSERPENILLRIGGRKGFLERFIDGINFKGKLELYTMTSELAYEKLLNNELDVALLSFKPEHQRLIYRKLRPMRIHWFHPFKEHRLKDFQTPALYDIPLLTFSSKRPYLSEWCDYYGLDTKKLNIRTVIDDWYIIKHLCVKFKAAALVPEGIFSFQKYDRDFVPGQVMDPVMTYYAYQESCKGTLKRGEFFIS